jgi:spore germination protein YaaH
VVRIRPVAGTTALATVLVTLAAVLVGLTSSAQAATAPPPPRKIVTGWLPYWSSTTSTDALVANQDLFSDSSPFWFTASSATTVKAQLDATTRASVTARIHAAGVPVIPTVTDSLPAHGMAAVLANPTARAQHVAALLAVVLDNGYDGIDLDYEKFAFSDGSSTWATTRPNWVAFVAQLSATLHAHGKRLTVAVPYMDSPTTGYWVYDYLGIGPYVDRMRIMTYDYSVSAAGPIAPISWVSRVAAFAVTQVPASKVQIGVPTYGYDWPLSTAGCPVDNLPKKTSYTAQQAAAVAASLHITPAWDATNGERTFSYHSTYSGHSATGAAATCTITRTVWYDDASAVALRAKLVGQYALGGVALWTVGGEDPAQWAAIRAYARTVAPTHAVLAWRITASTVAYGQPVTLLGTVRLTDGSRVAGAAVQLQAHQIGTSAWRTVATGTTTVDGTIGLSQVPSAFTEYRLVVVGTWGMYGVVGPAALVRVDLPPGSLVYTVPGEHLVGGQHWTTQCSPFATGEKCSAYVWTTWTVPSGSSFVTRTGWRLQGTTLADQATAWWDTYPLARPGTFTINGATYAVTCVPSVATGPRTCDVSVRTLVAVRSGGGWVARWAYVHTIRVLLSA